MAWDEQVGITFRDLQGRGLENCSPLGVLPREEAELGDERPDVDGGRGVDEDLR